MRRTLLIFTACALFSCAKDEEPIKEKEENSEQEQEQTEQTEQIPDSYFVTGTVGGKDFALYDGYQNYRMFASGGSQNGIKYETAEFDKSPFSASEEDGIYLEVGFGLDSYGPLDFFEYVNVGTFPYANSKPMEGWSISEVNDGVVVFYSDEDDVNWESYVYGKTKNENSSFQIDSVYTVNSIYGQKRIIGSFSCYLYNNQGDSIYMSDMKYDVLVISSGW